MIVYADILIVLNLIVDYLLIKATGLILSANAKTTRLVLAALVGAFSSLYIFFPETSIWFEVLYRIFICFLMSFFAFGFFSFKSFLKSGGILFIVTCGYAGLMMALWYIFKPRGMVINNGIVYFDISPLILVSATAISYLIFLLLYKIFSKTSKTAERCSVRVFADGRYKDFSAILDSGNSVVDIFGKSEIIIADKSVLTELFGDIDITKNKPLSSRYRLVPCSTVSGNDLLDAYRCDKANITKGSRTAILEKPILAVSKTKINGDYSAVLNPKIFEFGD